MRRFHLEKLEVRPLVIATASDGVSSAKHSVPKSIQPGITSGRRKIGQRIKVVKHKLAALVVQGELFPLMLPSLRLLLRLLLIRRLFSTFLGFLK